jgi:cytochrome c2
VLLLGLVPALIADHSVGLKQSGYLTYPACFAVAYLLCAWVLARRAQHRGRASALDALLLTAALLSPVLLTLALLRRPGTDTLPGDFSRRDLIAAAVLFVVLSIAVSGLRIRRIPLLLGMALIAVLSGAGLIAQYRGLLPGSRRYEDVQQRVAHRQIEAPFHLLDETEYRNFIRQPVAAGGGLTRLGEHMLLGTGDGALYVFDAGRGAARAAPRLLAVRVPINRDELIADRRPSVEVETFRVSDILVRQEAARTRLFAAHHFWKRATHCFVLRVSTLEADDLLQVPASSAWKTLYETSPCLRPEDVQRTPYTGFVEAGGRLALLDDRHLLLTTGDHEFDGLHSKRLLSQEPDSSYGKIILIDLQDGSASTYSSGHRDPQGLLVDRDGTIWSTEHGPQGGDELNRIVQGRNYGWPLVTLGTDYGRSTWPLSSQQGAHLGYEAPVFAWTPAIGISNLIRLESAAFPIWQGDLLVGSLKGRTLWRLRLADGHVQYAAPIRLGLPIRALAEDAQGRIVIWTDTDLVTLEPAAAVAKLEEQAAPCLQCHTIHSDPTEHGAGPNLAGVIGRRIATAPGFAYSSALQETSGTWDRSRLDAFLADPARAVPGNAMHYPGVADPSLRNAIIDFLQSRTR